MSVTTRPAPVAPPRVARAPSTGASLRAIVRRGLRDHRHYGSAIQDGIDPVAFAAVTLAGVVLAIGGAALLRQRDVLA